MERVAGKGSWVGTSSSDEGAEVVGESRACEEGPVVELEEECVGWRAGALEVFM